MTSPGCRKSACAAKYTKTSRPTTSCRRPPQVTTPISLVNVLSLVDQIINPEEQEIILLNSAKKYNVSASECVIGLEFAKPEFKKQFEARVNENKYKLTELKAKDPLLKILL